MSALTLTALREASASRHVRYYREGQLLWRLTDWITAFGGECGEALNVVKKLNRDRDGMVGNVVGREHLVSALGDELADVVIYLDLMLAAAEIDHVDSRLFSFQHQTEHPVNIAASELATWMFVASGKLASSVAELEHSRRDEGRLEIVRVRSGVVLRHAHRVARAFGIDLGAAVTRKFNADSEKHGFPERLAG